MRNTIWLFTKFFLIKRAQSQLVGKRTRDLISHLYNCMAVDRFGYANYSQSPHSEYAQHVGRSLTDRFSFVGVRLLVVVRTLSNSLSGCYVRPRRSRLSDF